MGSGTDPWENWDEKWQSREEEEEMELDPEYRDLEFRSVP